MEYGTLVKQIHVDASPTVVYEVISSPEHIAQWWGTDAADLEPTPGRSGVLTWRERATTTSSPLEVRLTVVDAVPGKRFAFRWLHPEDETPTPQNSVLVTFQLTPDGNGTLLKVTEEGMREQGWEAAVLEEYYNSHDHGWTRHLANLATYAAKLATR
jgi:uncharacterized protein YndB with AHSA1/START domain